MPPKKDEGKGKRQRRRDGEEEGGTSECIPDVELSTSSSTHVEEEEEELGYDELRERENRSKLEEYIGSMAYRLTPVPPCKPKFKRTCEELAKPKPLLCVHNYETYCEVYEPKERCQRMGRISSKINAKPIEDFVEMFKASREAKLKKINLEKRKQKVFYNMVSRMENYSRSEYLGRLVDKFGDFVAKLATTMDIPEKLDAPFCRMHHGLFCNICIVLKLKPIELDGIDLRTKEGMEYDLVNSMSHALLSLIIKALDAAASMDPNDIKPDMTDCEISEYLRQRLMSAAAKKVMHSCKKKGKGGKDLDTEKVTKKCEEFAEHDPCFNQPAQIF